MNDTLSLTKQCPGAEAQASRVSGAKGLETAGLGRWWARVWIVGGSRRGHWDAWCWIETVDP